MLDKRLSTAVSTVGAVGASVSILLCVGGPIGAPTLAIIALVVGNAVSGSVPGVRYEASGSSS